MLSREAPAPPPAGVADWMRFGGSELEGRSNSKALLLNKPLDRKNFPPCFLP
jgi:hypothetical protein